MGLFSYARYFIGIILSFEIIRIALTESEASSLGIWLAVIYLVLAVAFVFRAASG